MQKAGLGVLVSMLVFAGGCQVQQAHLRLAATHGSGLGPTLREQQAFTVKRSVEGRSRAVTSVLFFPLSGRPSLAEAIADAVENAGGGAALSAEVESRNWWLGASVSEIRVRVHVAQISVDGAPPVGEGEFSALSNDWIRPRVGIAAEGPRVENVVGNSRVRHFLWVSTQPKPALLQDALDDAIHAGGGNVLVDADVEYTWQTYFPFYGVERWRVRGDSVRSPWGRGVGPAGSDLR